MVTHPTAQHNIPEGLNLQQHCCENFYLVISGQHCALARDSKDCCMTAKPESSQYAVKYSCVCVCVCVCMCVHACMSAHLHLCCCFSMWVVTVRNCTLRKKTIALVNVTCWSATKFYLCSENVSWTLLPPKWMSYGSPQHWPPRFPNLKS
jgi:hypothetical protein